MNMLSTSRSSPVTSAARFIGIEGGGAPVRFRMLHVFDICDGLISREQAWFDTAEVVRQLESHRRGAAEPIGQ